jgi:hypothetical protein
MKRLVQVALFAATIITCAITPALAQLPRTISFQGVLGDATGALVPNGPAILDVAIYDAPTGGTALFTERLNVTVLDGVFNAIIGSSGSGIPVAVDFDKQYWLGVTVGGGVEIAPRTPFTSVPYALNAAVAQHSLTADRATNSDTATHATHSNTSDAVTGGFVTSLNGQQGVLEIMGAGATRVTRAGNQIIITSTDTSGGAIRRIDNFDGSLVIDPPQGPFITMFIREQGVQTHHLRDMSITTAKIIDGAVTTPKIGDGAVTTPKISNGAVTTEKIADNAVTTPKIADQAVTLSKINHAGALVPQAVISRARTRTR